MKRGQEEAFFKMNMNVWSFILFLCCIPAFFMATSSATFVNAFTKIIGTHPLNIVLTITLLAFVLGVIGLKDVREWKAMTRSLFTIILTMIFSGILIVIIFFGSLLS